jgi:hypothetical protein
VCEAFRNHLLKDLEDIQIAHRHQSEHEFQPLTVGIFRVVLGLKAKRNALLHAVEVYLHRKVKEARVYESVLCGVLEGVLESVYGSDYASVFDNFMILSHKSVFLQQGYSKL